MVNKKTGDDAQRTGQEAYEELQENEFHIEKSRRRLEPDERQFLPDTGDRPPSPTGRSDEDLMEEARDGFMNRNPPKGQTS